MLDYLKDCFCLKYRGNVDPKKVKCWCLRWNCRHLRSKFKKRRKKRNKNQLIIEIEAEINLFFEEKGKEQ